MRRARPFLGTRVDIDVGGGPPAALEPAVEAAFAAVRLVHGLMSFHEPDSDLSRLNRGAARAPVRVHPWTAKVLRRAKTLYEATHGLFDCAVGHELSGWTLLPDHGFPTGAGDFGAVRFLPDGRIAFAAPIALDLGGIAKGFAVDRAVAALRRHGIRVGSVNAGGDLRVFGDEAQPIVLRPPTGGPLIPCGLLRNGAIATSSAAATLKRAGGREVSALVQAGTRAPVLDQSLFSVIAPTCLVADALTKVLAQVKRTDAPCFARFDAVALITPADAWARGAA